mmetsp:Transcript_2186/g.2817  ORF Transcript_2186/g.2817 Transcript_2186/m.2817 type:complete len:131 (-) Transcript_2186:251-643(-)
MLQVDSEHRSKSYLRGLSNTLNKSQASQSAAKICNKGSVGPSFDEINAADPVVTKKDSFNAKALRPASSFGKHRARRDSDEDAMSNLEGASCEEQSHPRQAESNSNAESRRQTRNNLPAGEETGAADGWV